MATAVPPDLEPKGPSPFATASVNVRRRLSDELELILQEFDIETVTLREVIQVLHGRGYVLLVMLLALPFCTPVPLPGLSTPLGAVIALIGIRLSLGEKPWLPARLLDTRLPPATFRRVFFVARKLVLAFEKLLRPRLRWVTASPRLEQFHAIPIVLCAVMLLLPLPVPFSNAIPAWGVLLIAGGLLEHDGVFILAGYLSTLFALTFFAVIGLLGAEAIEVTWHWLLRILPG